MIEALEIDYFQSHQHTLMEFVSGVNAIVGPSDEGKSAIIRSIGWAVNNDPSGIAFRSHFADKKNMTRVALSMNDGRWVVRERDEATNRYSLWNVKDPMEAFGQGPVKEVLETLNFSGFAIQGQHEQYFLLQSSPGEVSRILNEMTGLGVSDDILKKVGSILYKVRDGISNAAEQIERLTEEIKEYAYLDKLEVDLGKLEKALMERELARDERKGLINIVGRLNIVDEEITEFNLWLEIEPEAQGLINEAQDVGLLLKEKQRLQDFIENINVVDEDIKAFEEQANDHQKSIQLQQDMRDIYWMRDEKRKLEAFIERMDVLEKEIIEADGALDGLQGEREQLGIICKKCGARVDV